MNKCAALSAGITHRPQSWGGHANVEPEQDGARTAALALVAADGYFPADSALGTGRELSQCRDLAGPICVDEPGSRWHCGYCAESFPLEDRGRCRYQHCDYQRWQVSDGLCAVPKCGLDDV